MCGEWRPWNWERTWLRHRAEGNRPANRKTRQGCGTLVQASRGRVVEILEMRSSGSTMDSPILLRTIFAWMLGSLLTVFNRTTIPGSSQRSPQFWRIVGMQATKRSNSLISNTTTHVLVRDMIKYLGVYMIPSTQLGTLTALSSRLSARNRLCEYLHDRARALSSAVYRRDNDKCRE